ncbi:MAG: DNA phosphorothioation-dependent restriction protein DptG, partial [Pseudohongiellaceae bacterium]
SSSKLVDLVFWLQETNTIKKSPNDIFFIFIEYDLFIITSNVYAYEPLFLLTLAIKNIKLGYKIHEYFLDKHKLSNRLYTFLEIAFSV